MYEDAFYRVRSLIQVDQSAVNLSSQSYSKSQKFRKWSFLALLEDARD